jgi:acetate kinase
VIFHLHRQYGLSFEQIEHLLYYDSGLKGVSGISADLRELTASRSVPAQQAIDLFVHHCVSAVGAYAAVLGGVDALVFSGGIGSRAPAIRASICSQLEFLGVLVDTQSNVDNSERISPAKSKVAVFALATNEELMIARHCRAILTPVGPLNVRSPQTGNDRLS